MLLKSYLQYYHHHYVFTSHPYKEFLPNCFTSSYSITCFLLYTFLLHNMLTCFFSQIFSMIHVNYYTPTPAIIVMCIITIIYIFIGDFDTLIAAFGFTSWTFYGMNAASVLILRRKLPDIPRPYKVSKIFAF